MNEDWIKFLLEQIKELDKRMEDYLKHLFGVTLNLEERIKCLENKFEE